MAYEVLARKWRPRQFDDVVGQAHVTETLKNAITTHRIAHAYLFVGPRGIGKTSVARIFAKALNCVEGPTVTPCDKCDSCLEVAKGTSLDVIEIDGATTGGVDEVRSLRETLKYAPVKAPYKIYIIDEVHMLSSAAFNALLKTLEEPPPHVKFEFATTEPQKILPTIISRCQRFDLRRIPVPLIIERLQLVAREENIEISADALLAIARGAEGGLRDAESALDQLISFKGKTIGESDVLSVFGLTSRQMLEDTVTLVLQGQMAGLIRVVATLDEGGKDLQRLVFDLMDYFKNLLVVQAVGSKTEGLDLTEAQIASMKRQAALTTTDHVLRIIQILMETEERMRYALLRRTLLETALVRCARAAVSVTLDQVLEALKEAQTKGVFNVGSVPSPSLAPVEPVIVATPVSAPPVASTPTPPVHKPEASPAPGPVAAPILVPEPRSAEAELVRLQVEWGKVRARCGKAALPLRPILADAVPLVVEGDKVVIGFDAEFASEIDIVKSGRNYTALERTLSDTLGRKVTFEMKAVPVEHRAMKTATTPAADLAPTGQPEATSAPEPAAASPTDVARLIEDPAIQKTMDMFEAKILDVRS